MHNGRFLYFYEQRCVSSIVFVMEENRVSKKSTWRGSSTAEGRQWDALAGCVFTSSPLAPTPNRNPEAAIRQARPLVLLAQSTDWQLRCRILERGPSQPCLEMLGLQWRHFCTQSMRSAAHKAWPAIFERGGEFVLWGKSAAPCGPGIPPGQSKLLQEPFSGSWLCPLLGRLCIVSCCNPGRALPRTNPTTSEAYGMGFAPLGKGLSK